MSALLDEAMSDASIDIHGEQLRTLLMPQICERLMKRCEDKAVEVYLLRERVHDLETELHHLRNPVNP